MSSRNCDTDSLMSELAMVLTKATSIEDHDALLNAWADEVMCTCGQESVGRVLTLMFICEAKSKHVPPEAPKKKLVLLLHGIRDRGEWMEMVRSKLRSQNVTVVPLTFGYLDSVRFMGGLWTTRIIRGIEAKFLSAQANNKADETIVIAHSFGTFVVANLLLNASYLRFSHVVFCGSVVSSSFRFDSIPNRPEITNECGGRDIWPVVAQGFSLKPWGRYGAGGVWGMRTSEVYDRFHDTRHSDYLTPEFVDKFWYPLVHHGERVESEFDGNRRITPLGVSYLAFGWLTVAIVVLGPWVGLYLLKCRKLLPESSFGSSVAWFLFPILPILLCLWIGRDVWHFVSPKMVVKTTTPSNSSHDHV